MTPTRNFVVLYINGIRHAISGADAFIMLADYLRKKIHLTGTKIVCAEGDCGACTVLKAPNDRPIFEPINACIALVFQLDGCHLVTVEGLPKDQQLSPVQKALVTCNASQCGFCTPGFAVALTALFEKPPHALTEQKVKNCLTGNLCRCTGYKPFIEAAMSASQQSLEPLHQRYLTPEAIVDLAHTRKIPLHIQNDNRELSGPIDLKSAITLQQSEPVPLLVGGATDLGVAVNKGRRAIGRVTSLHLIPKLHDITHEKDRITVGALASINDVRRYCKNHVPVFSRFLNIFASPQIKNQGTLVGNVVNGSPIADTLPALMVLETLLHIEGPHGVRKLSLEQFYTGYKTTALMAHEIITHLSFAMVSKAHNLQLEKVSNRRDLDIATVNAAFVLALAPSTQQVADVRLSLGGVGPTVLLLRKTAAVMQGQTLNQALVEKATSVMLTEIAPISDVRASADYRRVVSVKLFQKYCEGVMNEANIA
jgi:xanthine dehydrogenase small subunit